VSELRTVDLPNQDEGRGQLAIGANQTYPRESQETLAANKQGNEAAGNSPDAGAAAKTKTGSKFQDQALSTTRPPMI